MHNIYDGLFNGMPRSEMYRSQSFPELFPAEKPMLIQNWSEQDRAEYCGGIYTEGYAEMKAKVAA